MDEMHEIVTVEQVERLFLLLAVAGPVAGLLLGAVVGTRRGNVGRGAAGGFGIGLLCVLNLVLWKVYNLLTDRMGLDSVKNLFVQLALFVGLGAAAGLAFGYFARVRIFPRPDDGPFTDDGGSAPVGAVPGGPEAGSGSAARRFEESEEPPREP